MNPRAFWRRPFAAVSGCGDIVVLIALLLAGMPASLEAQNRRESKDVVVPEGYWSIGPYDVRLLGNFFNFKDMIDRETGEARYNRLEHRLQIFRHGILLEHIEGHRLELSPWPRNDYTPPPIGANVIGTATPNLIVYGWSGGAHCCYTTHIYDLGDSLRKIDTFDTGDYDLRFVQLDDDPALEIEIHDTIYGYWRTGFADSVAPVVILKFDDVENSYEFASALMRRPPPAETELGRKADAVRAVPWRTEYNAPPSNLWGVMLDLIYSGNYPLARLFLDRAWNDALTGKEEFWNELIKCQMRKSQFWPYIAALNGLAAEKPEGECPGSQ